MSREPDKGEAERLEQAADWIVRLQGGDADDGLAFDAWLEADPGHKAAYDRAIAVWDAYGRAAPAVMAGLAQVERDKARRLLRRRRVLGGFAATAAAACLAVVVLPQLKPPAAEAYETARGERRSVHLADGSTIDLNAGTRLSVVLGRGAREVTLEEGEAVFDVAADARRPFLIAAGDRTVRVVGTQFDVRRRAGQLSVTVARGVVEVRPSGGASGEAFRLRPGQRLDHSEGATAARISAAAPEEVFGWRSGRLVIRDQPLSQVVAELNRQFERPIRLGDEALGEVRVSGVLVLDDEEAVVRRLSLLVPLRATPTDQEILLRRE